MQSLIRSKSAGVTGGRGTAGGGPGRDLLYWPRVRGVGVCVWARVSAAPRHSWLGCWAVCVLPLHPATPGHGCAVWVCVFGLGSRLRPATPGWGVGLCACSACTQPLLARVRGVGGCVWARVSAAPCHSWLGCWAVCVLRLHPATPGHGCTVWVCVFGLGFRLRRATPGWGVGLCVCSACTQPLLATGARCGCVCLGSGFGCAPPLLAAVLGCVRAPLAPSHSWHGCAVWVCVFGLGFRLRPPLLAGVLGCVRAPLAPSHYWPRVRGVGVCVSARVSAAPRHSWLGCWALCVLRFHPATPGHGCAVWVCVFGLGFRLRPATPGWGVGLCACSACTQPLLATGARCWCVCLGSGFGCAPPLLAGVLGCVCAPLAPSPSRLCVSLGAVLCVPCRLRSVRCCASLCWCACAVLFVWCVLLLAHGAVVRCRVLCCFLWCAVVRCWVWWPVVVCWCRAVAPCCPFCFVGGAGLCLFPVCAVLCCAARRVFLFRLRLRFCWCLVLWRVPVCCGVSLGILRCGGAALVCRGVLLCCALSCGVLRPVSCPAVLCCLAVLCWWAVLCGCLRCWCLFFLLSSTPLLITPAVFPCL